MTLVRPMEDDDVAVLEESLSLAGRWSLVAGRWSLSTEDDEKSLTSYMPFFFAQDNHSCLDTRFSFRKKGRT
jgi:hypothetical protein